MNILDWLGQNGYDYTWNFKLGGRTPDIIGFKEDEVAAFEFKKSTLELSTAIGQCLQYRRQASKVYVVLPSSEKRHLSKIQISTLKRYGIGLVLYNEKLDFLVEAENSFIPSKRLIEELKKKSMSGTKPLNSKDEIKQKILEVLKDHPEGLSIQEISEELGMHRHTVTKYVYFLGGAGEVFVRKVGMVSLVYHRKLRPTNGQKGESRFLFSKGGSKR